MKDRNGIDATPSIGEVLDMMEGYDYDLWDAVFELVDNSFDSFNKNRKKLARAGKKKWEINITLDNSKRTFRITDNAHGMSRKELERGLILAKANQEEGVIGKYGMGLKTSASWLGKFWTVKTKRLGSNTELTATVDIPKLIKSDSNIIPIVEKPVKDKNSSYTIIEVKNAPRKYGPRTQSKTKRELEMTYQKLLNNEKLVIQWKGESLNYKEPAILEEVIDTEGRKKKIKYQFKLKKFDLNGSKISGQYGIYEPTGTQTAYAGLTMFYNNRVILSRKKNKWMERVFGAGPGDLARQRLFLKLDCQLKPNALKTDFVWDLFTIEQLEEAIIKQTDGYILELRKIATKFRKTKGELSGAAKKLSDSDIKNRMESDELTKALIEADPKAVEEREELTNAEIEAMKKSAQSTALKISIAKGRPNVEVYMGLHHETEPFLTIKTEPQKILCFVNPKHPFYSQKVGADPELYQLYLDFCVSLALSKWSADKQDVIVGPENYLGVLDLYLRSIGKATED